jgi:hypothetical protein
MVVSNINIRDWKYRLMEQLFHTEDIVVLKEVEMALKKSSSLEERIFKPMRKNISLAALVEEQNYQAITAEAFFKEVEEINLEEDINQLLD